MAWCRPSVSLVVVTMVVVVAVLQGGCVVAAAAADQSDDSGAGRARRTDQSDDRRAGRARRTDLSPTDVLLELQAQQLAVLTAQITALTTRLDQREVQVGFQARRSSDPFPVTSGRPVVLDEVVTNVGNAYDTHSGVFTAPVAGLYAIHATCMASSPSTFGLSLMKDDEVVGQCWSQSPYNQAELGSTDLTLQLAAGDRVWANSLYTESVRGAFWTTLGGHLVQADV